MIPFDLVGDEDYEVRGRTDNVALRIMFSLIKSSLEGFFR